MLKESVKFVGKITLVHMITYIACGFAPKISGKDKSEFIAFL